MGRINEFEVTSDIEPGSHGVAVVQLGSLFVSNILSSTVEGDLQVIA